MKLVAIALASLTVLASTFAHAATSNASSRDLALATELRKDRTIEAKIEAAVAKETGFSRLQGTRILWNSINCNAVETSELSDQGGGACTVRTVAFQVSAEIAIVKTAKATLVHVIYADVE